MEVLEFNYVTTVTALLVAITTFFFSYWYSTRKFDFWKKRGIPYAKPTPFFGSVLEYLKTPIQELEYRRCLELGPVYGYFEGNTPFLTVADTKLLRKILVKDFPVFSSRREYPTNDEVIDKMLIVLNGEDWKRVRAIVTPTFSSRKLKRMIHIMKDCSEVLVRNFKNIYEKVEYLDAKRLYGAFTMDIIASSAFSTKIDSNNDPDNEFVKYAKRVFSNRLGWRYFLSNLFPSIKKLFRVSSRGSSINFFKDATLQIIKERKRTGQTREDFLQLLMDTAREREIEEEEELKEKSGHSTSGKENGDITSNYEVDDANARASNTHYSKKELSIEEVVAQCVIFFIAGYETTANTLSSVTYCLALNEDVQDKLHAEVNTVLKANNGEITYEAIQDMKYLDNVISEALRLYPPAVRFERIATADYFIPELGITVPKGMVVAVPIYAIHRSSQYFPNPEQFDPERFSAEKKAKRDPFAYLPFGNGPRNCVGMRFALLEMKICLAMLINSFRFKQCPETQIPLEFKVDKSLLSPKKIVVTIEPRKDYLLLK